MDLLRIIFGYFSTKKSLSRRIDAVTDMIVLLEERTKASNRELKKRRKALVDFQAALSQESLQLQSDLDEARQIIKDYQEQLEKARSEVRVMEHEVEALVASNTHMRAMWDAETAIQVRRELGANLPTRDD